MAKRGSPDLFAFWRYDRYPFVLGGRVTSMRRDGWVTVEGYQDIHFRPLLLLPVEAGEELLDELHDLERERTAALQELEREWQLKLQRLHPILGNLEGIL